MVKTSKDLSKAVAAAAEAEQAAARQRDSPEKKQARMDELEERAWLFGDSVKQSYNAKCLERKWLRFLLVHGDEIGFKASIGPTVKQVERFVTYCFCTRDVVSAIGREGVGDSYELQIRYMLAKFVFVSLGYKGWTKLSPHELHEKAEPYKFAVRGQWKRLKRLPGVLCPPRCFNEGGRFRRFALAFRHVSTQKGSDSRAGGGGRAGRERQRSLIRGMLVSFSKSERVRRFSFGGTSRNDVLFLGTM